LKLKRTVNHANYDRPSRQSPPAEADVRLEVAILLYQQYSLSLDKATQLAKISADDFYQILIDRNIVTPPADPDDEPAELILASLRNSMQQVKESTVYPISQLWMERSNALKKAI
jgi:predicted HTH domain antitoxin